MCDMRNRSLLLLGFLAFGLGLNAKTELAQLKVEYQQAPLAVEVTRPRFSWQMISDDNLKGWKQTAYEIVVTDEKGRQVWKSGIVKSDQSLNISYTGEPLAPTTRYVWSLNVWNQKKEKMTASSSFETGLVMRQNYNHSGDDNPKAVASLVLNPTGKRGGNYIAYPVVGDMGYAVPAKQKVTFSHVEVRNFRAPQTVITTLQEKPVLLDGGRLGLNKFVEAKENSAPMLRSVFTTEGKKISKARVYATARGIYDLYLNGKRLSDAYFNPGVTQYDKSQTYQTFDVTTLLKQGEKNAIGAVLSEGWWSGASTYTTDNWNFFGDRQSLLAQLQITYEDGTVQTVVTDPKTWKTYTDGPVRYGSFFQGEVYDALDEENVKGWTVAQYDDKDWQEATEVKEGHYFPMSKDYQLISDMASPILPIDTLTAK